MPGRQLVACVFGTAILLMPAAVAADGDLDPSDPNAEVPLTRYHSVMKGYEYTPIPSEPGDWRELNDRMERIGGPAGQLREPDEPLRTKKNQN